MEVARDRITIYSNAATDGDPIESFTTKVVADVPAAIENISGNERYRGGQLEGHLDWRVEIRKGNHISSLSPTYRVVVDIGDFAGQIIDIKYIKTKRSKDGSPPEWHIFGTSVED